MAPKPNTQLDPLSDKDKQLAQSVGRAIGLALVVFVCVVAVIAATAWTVWFARTVF